MVLVPRGSQKVEHGRMLKPFGKNGEGLWNEGEVSGEEKLVEYVNYSRNG